MSGSEPINDPTELARFSLGRETFAFRERDRRGEESAPLSREGKLELIYK